MCNESIVSRETNLVVLLSLSECGAASCSSQSGVTLVITATNLCATKLFGLTGVECCRSSGLV